MVKDRMNRRILRIPQGDYAEESVNTDFYHFLTVVLTGAMEMREKPKLTPMVEAYLMADFTKFALCMDEMKRLEKIWQDWWYAQYDDLDGQEYVQ